MKINISHMKFPYQILGLFLYWSVVLMLWRVVLEWLVPHVFLRMYLTTKMYHWSRSGDDGLGGVPGGFVLVGLVVWPSTYSYIPTWLRCSDDDSGRKEKIKKTLKVFNRTLLRINLKSEKIWWERIFSRPIIKSSRW